MKHLKLKQICKKEHINDSQFSDCNALESVSGIVQFADVLCSSSLPEWSLLVAGSGPGWQNRIIGPMVWFSNHQTEVVATMISYREFFIFHQLKADGLNHSHIARQLNVDRKSVRRYLSSEPGDTARVARSGYTGSFSILRDHLRHIRPVAPREFEIRFEAPQGEQVQVDISCCIIRYNEAPEQVLKVWLFSMVLGHNRWLWGKLCKHQ